MREGRAGIQPPSPAPQAALSRPRAHLFRVAIALGLLLFTEGASYLALRLRDGGWSGPEMWRRQRQRAASAPVRAGEPAGRRAAGAGSGGAGPQQQLSAEALHPYFGFVLDPGGRSPDGWPPADSQGFRRLAQPESGNAGPFVIGVFGGSVAEAFALGAGPATVARRLQGLPALAGRPVRMVNFAIPGFKQPQQLLALNYFLATGERLDFVIALDGYNEIELPVSENLPAHVNPFYPRGWGQRVAGLPDLPAQVSAGELVYLRTLRRERSAWCASPPLSASALCQLAWTTADLSLLKRISSLEAELARAPAGRFFASSGAPYDADRSADAVYGELAGMWSRSAALMHGLCKARGIRFVEFLQPNQYVAGSKPMDREERLVAIDPQQLSGSFSPGEGYRHLISSGEELARQGVPYRDLTGVFAGVSEMTYADNCCHLNWRGNEILGEAIGAEIAARLDGQP